MEIVGFRGSKSKIRHSGTILDDTHMLGRSSGKSKEDRKMARACSAMWHGRATMARGYHAMWHGVTTLCRTVVPRPVQVRAFLAARVLL